MTTKQTVSLTDLQAELADKQKKYGNTFSPRKLRDLADEIEALQIKIKNHGKDKNFRKESISYR